MKALIIIAACIALATVFKAVEYFTSRKTINSVGSKANNLSKDMPKININDPEELKSALEHYKGLAD